MGNVSKIACNGFKWEKNISKYDKKFMEKYDEDSNRGYILEEDLECLKNLHDLHNHLPFLPERMSINKCNKLVCNLYDKNKNVVHIIALKQAVNHRLVLKKAIE